MKIPFIPSRLTHHNFFFHFLPLDNFYSFYINITPETSLDTVVVQLSPHGWRKIKHDVNI